MYEYFNLFYFLLFYLLTLEKKAQKKVIEPTYLACQHHLFMTVGIKAAGTKSKKNTNCAIIGLGGGGLCTFIHRVLK